MLKIRPEQEKRKPCSFYLADSDVEKLKDIAKKHKTTVSKVIEGLLDTYGLQLEE